MLGQAQGASGAVLVLTTIDDVERAGTLARGLVERSLAACVNLLPACRSVYRWKGTICEEGETLLVIKTAAGRLDDIRLFLDQNHPYELPEMVVVDIAGGSPGYIAWLMESVGSSFAGEGA